MDMTVGSDYSKTLEEMKQKIEISKKRYSSVKKNSKKKKAKKKLNYNSREIATQLARASRSVGASLVLIRASSNLATLQKKLVTGDYDMNEMRAAIAHARSMVRCARLKKNNLLEEENLEREGKQKGGSDNISREQRARQIMQRELKKMRRRNRIKEKGKIDDAQRRYTRDMSRAASYAEEREAYGEAYREAYRQACREAGISAASSDAGGAEAASAPAADVMADVSVEAAPVVSVDICV